MENEDQTDICPKTEGKSDICPECGAMLTVKWSGVECKECGYWFCY